MTLAAFSLFGFAIAAETSTLVLKTDTGDYPYTVELVTTDVERAKGLMFRRILPKTHGMLFIYDTPQEIGMWMRNTYISLDMVFIDETGRVHRIETHTEPFSTAIITSGRPVIAVLELNAGQAEAIGLKPGDEVVHPGLSRAP
ncbi:MAG: DUF192 domain-containing protein [Alphaproteobacteria bacterium]